MKMWIGIMDGGEELGVEFDDEKETANQGVGSK